MISFYLSKIVTHVLASGCEGIEKELERIVRGGIGVLRVVGQGSMPLE
jgi:hypothetical protein